MDFTIFFDNTDVSKHIAKYASKAEKASHDYSAILNNHTHTTENHTPKTKHQEITKAGDVHRKLSRQTKMGLNMQGHQVPTVLFACLMLLQKKTLNKHLTSNVYLDF